MNHYIVQLEHIILPQVNYKHFFFNEKMLKIIDGAAAQWRPGSEAASLWFLRQLPSHPHRQHSTQERERIPQKVPADFPLGAPGQTPGTCLHLTRIREETGCTKDASFPGAGGKSLPLWVPCTPVSEENGVLDLSTKKKRLLNNSSYSDNCFLLSASYVPSTALETWREGIPHNTPPGWWWFRR